MIQRISPFFALIVCVSSLAGCAQDGAGTSAPKVAPKAAQQAAQKVAPNFTSKAAGFSIWLPVTPTEKELPGAMRLGTQKNFMFQADTKPVTYVVIATPIPANMGKMNAKEFLDGVEKGMTGQSKASVLLKKELDLNGVTGRELRTSMSDGKAISHAQIYVTPKISYQIMAVGLKKEVESQNTQIRKVLDSFGIIGQ